MRLVFRQSEGERGEKGKGSLIPFNFYNTAASNERKKKKKRDGHFSITFPDDLAPAAEEGGKKKGRMKHSLLIHLPTID